MGKFFVSWVNVLQVRWAESPVRRSATAACCRAVLSAIRRFRSKCLLNPVVQWLRTLCCRRHRSKLWAPSPLTSSVNREAVKQDLGFLRVHVRLLQEPSRWSSTAQEPPLVNVVESVAVAEAILRQNHVPPLLPKHPNEHTRAPSRAHLCRRVRCSGSCRCWRPSTQLGRGRLRLRF